MIVKYVTLDGYKKLLLEQEAKILPVPRVGDLVNIKYETDNGSFMAGRSSKSSGSLTSTIAARWKY
jgi:hypothetical protein